MKLPGWFGFGSAVAGIVLLLATFFLGLELFMSYKAAVPSSDLTTSMGTLLLAAMQALFLGVMGWVGSLLMLRGVDFMKVDRGVGVVTFKVDKGVGILTPQQLDDDKTAS